MRSEVNFFLKNVFNGFVWWYLNVIIIKQDKYKGFGTEKKNCFTKHLINLYYSAFHVVFCARTQRNVGGCNYCNFPPEQEIQIGPPLCRLYIATEDAQIITNTFFYIIRITLNINNSK